jgi:hypothetical protein
LPAAGPARSPFSGVSYPIPPFSLEITRVILAHNFSKSNKEEVARISNLANTKHAKIVIHRFKELSEITNMVEALQIIKPIIDNDTFDNRAVQGENIRLQVFRISDRAHGRWRMMQQRLSSLRRRLWLVE